MTVLSRLRRALSDAAMVVLAVVFWCGVAVKNVVKRG